MASMPSIDFFYEQTEKKLLMDMAKFWTFAKKSENTYMAVYQAFKARQIKFICTAHFIYKDNWNALQRH